MDAQHDGAAAGAAAAARTGRHRDGLALGHRGRPDAVTAACVFTEREQESACDTLVLVTARLPEDAVALELEGRVGSVRAIGDARSPGTIAAAVWDGRRYAEELDADPVDDGVPPFRREIVQLGAPRFG